GGREGDWVVTGRGQRLASGAPDEDGLPFLGGRLPSFDNRHVPRNRPPQLVLGRLKLFVQLVEIGDRQAGRLVRRRRSVGHHTEMRYGDAHGERYHGSSWLRNQHGQSSQGGEIMRVFSRAG